MTDTDDALLAEADEFDNDWRLCATEPIRASDLIGRLAAALREAEGEVPETPERANPSDPFFAWTPPSPGDRIMGVTRVRDCLVVTTEWFIYHVREGHDEHFEVQQMTWIP